MEDIKTIEEVVERLKECQNSGDREVAHMEADDLLLIAIKLLSPKDYEPIAYAYGRIDKWYA